MQSNSCSWKIVAIENETSEVKTLVLEACGERPSFISGQYLTVRLPNFEPIEGKAYSIASSANETTVRLTIKAMGAFSHAILAHKIGDTLTTSLPYGFFYPETTENRDFAFVAGGIGITPCMGIIKNLIELGYKKQISLFYSNRTLTDTVFKNTLDTLMASHTQFNCTYYLTQENPVNESMCEGRITPENILSTLPNPRETDFFICGSIDFTKSMWKSLKDAGISAPQLYTEGFF